MPTPDDRKKNQTLAAAVCVAAVLLLIAANSLPDIRLFERPGDHLSVHLILEMFSIMVSVMVVSVAWNTLNQSGEAMAKALVFGFTVVAGADIAHAITYAGMPSLLVDGSTAEAISFWLSGRSVEVFTVLLVATGVNLPGSRRLWLGLALLGIAAMFYIGTYKLAWLPTLFVPNLGVSSFKVGYEYGLCLSNLLLAGWLFYKSCQEKQPRHIWLGTACFVMGIGELAFTRYVSTAEFLNVFGHLYKIAAYAFIYRAIFLIGIREPYELLARSEQKIRAQENELHTLLANLRIGIARLDKHLCYRYANPALATEFGKPLTQIIGTHSSELVSADIREKLRPLRQALHGQRAEVDIEYGTPSGRTAYAHVIAVPERQGEGNDDGILAIYTDTTEREFARRGLAESLREITELKAALDAHAIVAVTDAHGVITRVNDKFCSISQYPRRELIGQTHRIINSGHHSKAFFQDLWRTISRGQVWNGEICNRAKDGSLYWVYTTIVPFIGTDGVPVQYIAIRADISKRKEAEQEAQRMAFHDALTGLANRRLMGEHLKRAISAADRERSYGALLLMDLDNFKEINDTLGHAVGDDLLRQVSNRLLKNVRNSDLVARLGGDEFVVVLENLGDELEAATMRSGDLGEKLREALNHTYNLQGQDIVITPSIGVVLFSLNDDDPDELIKQADMALYKAKGEGRNRLCFFDPSLQSDITARTALLRDLRQALDLQQMRLYYQPVVDAQRQVLGVEALIRWLHPVRGMVSPLEFIPLAEQSGLILPIGQWVLETACAQLQQWAKHPQRQHWTIAVNVSAKQFNEADFVQHVEHALLLHAAKPNLLRLELTESMLDHDVDATIVKMQALRQQGVRFSLDDFGTGYSSLSYLKRLPMEQLKIDKSFVNDVLNDPNDAAIARTIIALASNLDLGVVAEGVETAEQLAFLVEHGCQAFQGYLFSRPLPIEELEAQQP